MLDGSRRTRAAPTVVAGLPSTPGRAHVRTTSRAPLLAHRRVAVETVEVAELSGADIGFPKGTDDEKELLLQFLGYVRGAVLRDVAGLSDEQARRRPDGKLMSLTGILNHLTRMEWRWMDGGYEGAAVSKEEAEFTPGPELTLAAAVEAYEQRAAKTDAMVRAIPLDRIGGGWAKQHDLRFVVLHVIEETARHAGHADATRELLDGSTGL